MEARRILLLTNRVPYPLNDGGNLAMHAMIEGYYKAGWQVHVLAMNTSRHPVSAAQLQELYVYLHGFDTVEVNNDVRPWHTITNFLFSRRPNHADRFYHQSFLVKTLGIIADFKPHAIQFESVFLTTYLSEIKKHTSAITILRLHNIEYEVWERLANRTTHPLKRLYLKNLAKRIRWFEELAWARYDLLMPITGADAHIVRLTGVNKNIAVAPFALKIHKPQVIRAEEWNGYHIGAMDWLPNAEGIKWFLEEVWPPLHSDAPDFLFYYAGRNMPGAFKQNNPEGVMCVGEVPDADAFIADKKILVVPLRSGSGIRVKILEAMAAGKVTISTTVGIQGINAIPGRHFLLADDAASFKNAIVWCLANKDAAEEIAANAMHLIAHEYDPDFIMEQVISRIEPLIQAAISV